MDLNLIKQISIVNYLSQMGIEPVRKTVGNYLYHAPYREDKHPSFSVNLQKNTWYDFGTGEGTSIIDLVMQIHHIDFKEAVKKLSGERNQAYIQIKTQAVILPYAPAVNVIKVIKKQSLANPALLQYLQHRAIDVNIAAFWTEEIHYTIGDRQYFAIGFANDSGGYELRNKHFKGASRKDITTYSQVSSLDQKDMFDTCLVFEGFMNYLSYLTMYKDEPNQNICVLNSVSLLRRAKEFILKHKNIITFLDNDIAGRKATDEIKQWGPPVSDMSSTYEDFNDLNDYLQNLQYGKI